MQDKRDAFSSYQNVDIFSPFLVISHFRPTYKAAISKSRVFGVNNFTDVAL